MNKKIACIDIGTNTLLMVICSISENNNIEILNDYHKIARLGYQVDASANINEEAIKRAKIILKEYREILDKYEISNIKVIATSALRGANNKTYVCSQLEEIIKNPIHILSGEEEATLSFLGTVENNNPSFVLDIGGGSTEIILGAGQNIIFRESVNLGAVRITERYFKTIPPAQEEVDKAIEQVRSAFIEVYNKLYQKLSDSDDNSPSLLNMLLNNEIPCYAVAGTATTMTSIVSGFYEFDFSKIHNYFVSQEALDKATKDVLQKDRFSLEKKYKVVHQRSDILQGGAIILNSFIAAFKLQSFYCSCKGLRFGPIVASLKQNY